MEAKALARAARLVQHLQVGAATGSSSGALAISPCIGESSHQVVDIRDSTKFTRIPLKLVFADKSAKDERYGGPGDSIVVEGELLKPPTASKTVNALWTAHACPVIYPILCR